jgi:hypothetical protein
MYTIIDEENLNSDGQQVNEYQQSEQSSFALNYELKNHDYKCALKSRIWPGTGTKSGSVKTFNGIQ